MIINSSLCLKYSRPRFAAKRPTQHRAQISPVKSRGFLRFIHSDNYHELTRLKKLRDRGQAFPVQGRSLNEILWATDAVFFTAYDFPVKNRCLKVLFVQIIVGQFVFGVDGKDIVTLLYQRTNFRQYSGVDYVLIASALFKD